MAFNTDEMSPTGPVWHPSFQQAAMAAPASPTDVGRQALAALRAARAPAEIQPRRKAAAPAPAWSDMPELYRRMVARAAGLGADVVAKRDRELTEQEKTMLRSAISDMRTWLAAVAAL